MFGICLRIARILLNATRRFEQVIYTAGMPSRAAYKSSSCSSDQHRRDLSDMLRCIRVEENDPRETCFVRRSLHHTPTLRVGREHPEGMN